MLLVQKVLFHGARNASAITATPNDKVKYGGRGEERVRTLSHSLGRVVPQSGSIRFEQVCHSVELDSSHGSVWF